jgi:Tfp pilus assembly protein PilX
MTRRSHLHAAGRDERGIALIMALGIMFVLAIAAAAALQYTSAGSRHASYSKSNTSAFSLAEAGVNSALSVLSNTANDPLNGGLLPTRTTNFENGSVTWSGTLDTPSRTWTVNATGRIANPTGASDVTRAVTSVARVETPSTTPVTGQSWNFLMVTRTGNACDLIFNNSVDAQSPIYVRGNLCLDNGSAITGVGPLHVGDRLTLIKANNNVGTAGSPISAAHIKNGCMLKSQPWSNPCSSADNVFANTIDSNPDFTITAPTADFSGWYQQAAIGPARDCTTKSGPAPIFDTNYPTLNNNVTPAFNLTPNSSYTCQSWNGTLDWDFPSKTLTVNGTIYIDGSATSSTPLASYNGSGALYLSGTFQLGNNSKLCAVVSGSDCNWNGWNPNNELLAIVANASGNSITLAQSSEFQGALWATDTVDIQNSAHADGPIIASNVTIANNTKTDPFQNISSGPWGLPGNEPRYAKITPLQFKG